MADLPEDAQRTEPVRALAGLDAAIEALTRLVPSQSNRDRLEAIIESLRGTRTLVAFIVSKRGQEPWNDEDFKRQADEWRQVLRQKRDAAGLTQADLSRKAKVSERTIRDLETGPYLGSANLIEKLLTVRELKLDPRHPFVRRFLRHKRKPNLPHAEAKQWLNVLRQSWRTAGLKRSEVAGMAEVSPEIIRELDAGDCQNLSSDLVERLVRIPELRLSRQDPFVLKFLQRAGRLDEPIDTEDDEQ